MRTIVSSRRDRYLAILTVFLVMVALIAGMVGCTGQQEEEEEEEEEEQYIEDWYELNAIRNKLSGTYFLANNLDKDTDGYNELASPTANGGMGWEPIGTSASADRFTGTFDGTGYSISGLYIGRPDEDDVGLFGYIEGGIIENVGLVEVDVTGGNHTGALVGYSERGTVGSAPGLPYSTYSTGSVAGSDTVGGLVGCNWDGTVSLSQSSAHIAHVSGEAWRAGGLVGANWGNVLLCSYSGEVTGDHEVGGMVGLNGGLVPLAPTGHVISCQGEYTVTGNWFVGGAAGVNLGSLDGAIFKGEVNGALWKATSHIALNEGTAGSSHSSDSAPQGSYVGGLAGWNEGSISNSFAVGSASGNEYIGGVAGYIDYGGTVNGCFAVATVEGTEHFGPLAGENNGIVTDSASGTAEQMTDIATFLAADWDICLVAPGEVNTACTWNMAPGDYPFLSGKQLEQYNLTISSTEGGEVTSPGEGIFTYYEGSVVNLVVEAEEGYQFSSWTGNVDTIADVYAASTTITVNEDYAVTANFAPRVSQPLTPLSPAAGSRGVPVTNIDFSWTDVTGADAYDWVLSENPDLSSPLDSETGLTSTATSYMGTLDYDTTYYWHVTAYGEGYAIAQSTISEFTTSPAPP